MAVVPNGSIQYRGLGMPIYDRDQRESVVKEPCPRAVEGGEVGCGDVVPTKNTLCLRESAKYGHLVRKVL